VTTGIVITGTRGSGKTTLAVLLTAQHPSIGRVPSTTTRGARADDRPGTYRYVTELEFALLHRSAHLVLVGHYGPYHYGIQITDIDAVLRSGRRPLITVAPREALGLVRTAAIPTWQGVFLDASDDALDERLAADGRPTQPEDRIRRAEDRIYAVAPLIVVTNDGSVEATGRLLTALVDRDPEWVPNQLPAASAVNAGNDTP
jgi:guanylate kinase